MNFIFLKIRNSLRILFGLNLDELFFKDNPYENSNIKELIVKFNKKNSYVKVSAKETVR